MSDTPEYLVLQVPIFDSHQALAVLVNDVKNLDTIKTNLIQGNKEYDYAFINGKNIVCLEQLYSAYYKVMQNHHYGTMKSKSLHTEIIYALSPFKNIMDCLNKFGVSKQSDTLLVLKIVKSEHATAEYFSSEFSKVKTIVDGSFVALSDMNLQTTADIKSIVKNYKYKVDASHLEPNWGIVTRNLVSIIQLKGL